jgi:prevent-host-death family protein
MPIAKFTKNTSIVVSALYARSNFGLLLNRVEKDARGLVIEKRGTPRAILLSLRDYIRLASPEPEVLKAIGAESKLKGTAALSSRQIERIIKNARARKRKSAKRSSKS